MIYCGLVVFTKATVSHSVDWRLWFGPRVRLPPEALHPRSGDAVVQITGAAAWSKGKNCSLLRFTPTR